MIDFLLARDGNWGDINIFETYDSVKDELGKRLASFEYSHGTLLKSDFSYLKSVNGRIVVAHGDIEALKEKRKSQMRTTHGKDEESCVWFRIRSAVLFPPARSPAAP